MKSKIINLPKITDPRGNLTFVEGNRHIPFNIKRAYWIYDVPGGETRGGHSFKIQNEFIIALSGSFDVLIDDGINVKHFSLNRSYFGLYVPAGNWRSMTNFSTNSLALVLASTYYDSEDYIRDYRVFKEQAIKEKTQIKTISENRESIVDTTEHNITTSVNDCQILNLDKNHQDKGNITVVENNKNIFFDIERVYYLYDIPGGEERGGHAHKELTQFIIAAGGSFDVEIDDGSAKKCINLNRPYQALKIVPGIWRELKNFSSGSTCLVLASKKFSEQDYIREYSEFKLFKQNNGIMYCRKK